MSRSKLFGQCELVVGSVYELKDIVAADAHRPRQHQPCKVLAVEVGKDSVIRVGVAFKGPHDTSKPHEVDALGYALEVSSWVFPSMLR